MILKAILNKGKAKAYEELRKCVVDVKESLLDEKTQEKITSAEKAARGIIDNIQSDLVEIQEKFNEFTKPIVADQKPIDYKKVGSANGEFVGEVINNEQEMDKAKANLDDFNSAKKDKIKTVYFDKSKIGEYISSCDERIQNLLDGVIDNEVSLDDSSCDIDFKLVTALVIDIYNLVEELDNCKERLENEKCVSRDNARKLTQEKLHGLAQRDEINSYKQEVKTLKDTIHKQVYSKFGECENQNYEDVDSWKCLADTTQCKVEELDNLRCDEIHKSANEIPPEKRDPFRKREPKKKNGVYLENGWNNLYKDGVHVKATKVG